MEVSLISFINNALFSVKRHVGHSKKNFFATGTGHRSDKNACGLRYSNPVPNNNNRSTDTSFYNGYVAARKAWLIETDRYRQHHKNLQGFPNLGGLNDNSFKDLAEGLSMKERIN
ncbi:MAG: hypothetical protein GDA51_03760 [Ekhidna sp.]|nr:hypothetical protein [Ekhidna sp.]